MPLLRRINLAVVEIDQAAWVVLPRSGRAVTAKVIHEPLVGPFKDPADAWHWIERQPSSSTANDRVPLKRKAIRKSKGASE